ncbi:MAG: succinylglutamate desuccinylase/aspartoacylase family protein [Pseudomonadales bacterium]|nr:succinylglutamate desuccinylase/aspartoacylase family protein [Pseudomonadales bacterium]MCP5214080.1 succinylglutamate desuccinylase/aspartoacylase family protein [Pseudomonadales bacterium]MCP5302715.1 succinylglutamate desuccinylase/aspartoacylase family protein [Pseudomonadales bacterium]
MSGTAYPIRYWEAPRSDEIGSTVEQFLEQLEGPTWIYFPGQDNSRCRVVTTLLHGNEPSGLYAMHQWILSNETPVTDLYCFIGSVSAAKHPPGYFHHRMIPGKRDLNRCFRPPYNDEEGVVAADLLHRITSVQPEAVIDIHNTSGAGPSFAICTELNPKHFAISSLFTHRLIITDLKLGALMDYDDGTFSVTTIECGGAHDPQAHALAYQGFKRFAITPSLFSEALDQTISEYPGLDLYQHPIRVELIQGAALAFANTVTEGADLTLHQDVERYNFGLVTKGTNLGWLGAGGLSALVARDTQGYDHVSHYFTMVDNCLVTTQDLKLFMITKNIPIALSDCLFYLVPI